MLLRMAVAAALAALLMMFGVPARAEPRGDGIHTEHWFNNTSFLELKDDLAEASRSGKGLVLIWEQPGCSSCQRLHEVNFSDKRLVDYISPRFAVMTMNMFGEVPVTDFDGEKLIEKDLAFKHKVHFTPTTIFFDDQGQEVFRMPGYFKPYFYLAGFVFVGERGHLDPAVRGLFPRWMQANTGRMKQVYGDAPEG